MGTKLELSYLPNHRTPRTDAAASPLGPWLSVLDALGCRGGTKASELIAPFAPLFLRPVLYFCALLDIIPNSTITTTSQQIFHLPCSMLFWMQSETLLSPFIGAHGSKRPCANRAAPSTSFPPLWHTRVVTFAHHIHHSNTWWQPGFYGIVGRMRAIRPAHVHEWSCSHSYCWSSNTL